MPIARRTLGILLALGVLSPVGAEEVRTYRLEALSRPAEIVVDRWGVPHIYAAEHYDAFLVQGFNAARDRLWQIDLWRRRGLGRLAEVLGPDYVEQDRAARLFLYRGDMYREWLAYGSDAKRIAEAFVAGINAYVDLVTSRPELLPPEFELLEYRPERWQASDVVRIRSHGLWRNVASEVERARLYCRLGPEADAARRRLSPEWTPRVPEGLDPCDVPEGVLDLYRLAKAPVRFADPFGGGARRPERGARELRQQQLGGGSVEDDDGTTHPRQRPPPGSRGPLAPLHRAPRRAGPERDRRRRAGPARGIHRSQRAHRLRPHDLRHRPGGPLRVRDAPRRSHRSTATTVAGSRSRAASRRSGSAERRRGA